MRDRLAALLPPGAGACAVHSFHSLGLAILRADGAAAGLKADFRIADEPERRAALATALGVTDSKAARLLKAVSQLKRTGREPDDAETASALAACRRLGTEQNFVDFDDLVGLAVGVLGANAPPPARGAKPLSLVFVCTVPDGAQPPNRFPPRPPPPPPHICSITASP